MKARDLKKQQLEAIQRALFPGATYVVRLLSRTETVWFPSHDELFRAVIKAHDANVELCSVVHYLGCTGVGYSR